MLDVSDFINFYMDDGGSPNRGCQQCRYRTRDLPQAHPLEALIFMGKARGRQSEKRAIAPVREISYEYPVQTTTKGA
jgi:hypothetical protein